MLYYKLPKIPVRIITFVRRVSKKVKISINVLTTNVYKTNISILIKNISFFSYYFFLGDNLTERKPNLNS